MYGPLRKLGDPLMQDKARLLIFYSLLDFFLTIFEYGRFPTAVDCKYDPKNAVGHSVFTFRGLFPGLKGSSNLMWELFQVSAVQIPFY